jgi:hypothetical protein
MRCFVWFILRNEKVDHKQNRNRKEKTENKRKGEQTICFVSERRPV